MERLREETRAEHVAVESTTFAAAMADGTLKREHYVIYLQAMHLIYRELEREPFVDLPGRVWSSPMARTDMIHADLRALGAPSTPVSVNVGIGRAMGLAQDLRVARREDPGGLVGAFYVLEGSSLGGRILAKSVGQALDCVGGGVAYLENHGPDRGPLWVAFGERIDALSKDAHDAIVGGAVRMFERMRDLFDGVVNPESPRAASLNPEGGVHPIADDVASLEFALRASERTQDRFPYLQARFGERGRRFARSDAGWLATLIEGTVNEAVTDVLWLGRVLAARGVPRFVLEEHLRHLDEAFAGVAGFAASAATLAAERNAVCAPEAFAAHVDRFSEILPASLRADLPDLPKILVAMMCDEACGMPRAEDALLEWLFASGTCREAVRPSLEVEVASVRQQLAAACGSAGRDARRRSPTRH